MTDIERGDRDSPAPGAGPRSPVLPGRNCPGASAPGAFSERERRERLAAIRGACDAWLEGYVFGRALQGRPAFEGEDAAIMRRAAELGVRIPLHPDPETFDPISGAGS